VTELRKIEYFVANPAGNITIFVTTPVEQKDYQMIAEKLLAIEEHHAEQIAYIKEGNRTEMCGMEFCGNASRAFALWYGKNSLGINGKGKVSISVSGADEELDVDIDTDSNYTKIAMPKPLKISKWDMDDKDGILVDLDGIMHLVLFDEEADAEKFAHYNKLINDRFDPPATGVMFLKKDTLELVPVVYVRDVDTTYFEGSCGSGSTAVAIALSYGKPDGDYSFELKQPAGTITASTCIRSGKVEQVFIEGPVSFGEMLTLEF
jgi:diaminopimelate epimerase